MIQSDIAAVAALIGILWLAVIVLALMFLAGAKLARRDPDDELDPGWPKTSPPDADDIEWARRAFAASDVRSGTEPWRPQLNRIAPLRVEPPPSEPPPVVQAEQKRRASAGSADRPRRPRARHGREGQR